MRDGDAEGRDREARERGRILQQHREEGGVLRAAERAEYGCIAAPAVELLDGTRGGDAFEEEGDGENHVVDDGVGDGVRVEQLLDALVNGNARAQREQQDRDDEAPEIELFRIAEGVDGIGGPLGAPDAVQEQHLVSGVDEGVDRLR